MGVYNVYSLKNEISVLRLHKIRVKNIRVFLFISRMSIKFDLQTDCTCSIYVLHIYYTCAVYCLSSLNCSPRCAITRYDIILAIVNGY